MRSSEVIIIGGGVIGLAIARELAKRGIKPVTVMERGEFGAEASAAAGGMLAPQAEADRANEFFYLGTASRDLYPNWAAELESETGIDVGFESTGTLYLAFTQSAAAELDVRYRWQNAAGLAVERLTAAEILQLEPNVSPNVVGGLRFPLDTQVENRLLVKALILACRQLGVKLLRNTEAVSIDIEGERIGGVSSRTEKLAGNAVIVAGGSWSSLIPFSDGRRSPVVIEPVRGQMLCFETADNFAQHIIYSPRGYLIPRLDGRVLAGSTTEMVGYDPSVSDRGLVSIMSQASEISPAVSELNMTDHWSGLRPRSADGLPVVGAVDRLPGLFYATGHYRNGILLAPITAQALAEEFTLGQKLELMRPFGPERFDADPIAANIAHNGN
ncbi:MAG: glycine oxidase ThiO [Pyrinomonadaceae bacterium]